MRRLETLDILSKVNLLLGAEPFTPAPSFFHHPSIRKSCTPLSDNWDAISTSYGTPKGIRTPIATVKGWWPNLLVDGSIYKI